MQTRNMRGLTSLPMRSNKIKKVRTAADAGLLYRQFLAILDMWLQLRSKAIIIRNIRLFAFKKYSEYINKLQAEIDRLKQE